jgi:autotransporter-associated beta strand protein
LGLWLGLVLSLVDQSVFATSISFIGVEPSIGPAYATQNWSSPSAAKTFDLGGTEIYGTSGYYQLRPMPTNTVSNISEGAGAGNNLGITEGSNPTLYSPPVFLSSITGGAGTYVNFGGYPNFLGPDGTTIYRQGSLSVSVGAGPYNTPSGNNTGYYGDAFSFTMATNIAADFRIGIAVDTAGNGLYAPDYVSIFNSGTGSVFSSQLARTNSPKMTFFDVTASAGESFSVAMWQLAGSQSVAPFGLITFDVLRYKFDVGSGLTQTNSVVLTGSPATLVKTGAGTLVITSSNTYGAGTTISEGTFKLAGGSVAGNITNNANLTITGGTELVNIISGNGSLTKADSGLSILWSSNSYTGATVVEAGSLRLDGSGSLSASTTLQVASGTLFSATGVFKTSNNLTLAGLTGAGEVFNKAGILTVNKSSGTDTFEGLISGDQELIKSGDGTLILAGASSYTGASSIVGGRLVLGHSNALGGTSTGTVVVSGAQLRLNPLADTEFAAEPLSLSGEGLTGTVGGALRNATNNNTWKGKITLAANASIGAHSGTTLTLDVDSGDAIDLAGFDLVFDGAGMVQINDPIAGAGQISKIGSGQLVVNNSVLTATIQSNSVSVNFATPPADGTFVVLSGPLDSASLASVNVTGLDSGQTATVANSPNLVIQVADAPAGPTFDSAYPANSLTDLAPNGLTYLMNYAFGGSSTHAATLPSQDFNDPTKLTLVAFVRTDNTGGVLSVVGEAGDALSNFDSANPIPGEVALDQSDAPAGTEKRIFSVPANGDRLFLRLKATLTP